MKEKLKELEVRRKRTRVVLIINIVIAIIVICSTIILINTAGGYAWVFILTCLSSFIVSLFVIVRSWINVNREIDLLSKDV